MLGLSSRLDLAKKRYGELPVGDDALGTLLADRGVERTCDEAEPMPPVSMPHLAEGL